MPQDEYTGRREGPSNYSKWHRFPNLPDWCWMVDGDWFEYRPPSARIVAYIETIQTDDPAHDTPLWPSTKALLHSLMRKKLRFPVYVVWHNPRCTIFSVLRITGETIADEAYVRKNREVMNEEKYKDFIKKL